MKFVEHFMSNERLQARARNDIETWARLWGFEPTVIFDIGANVGMYMAALYRQYPGIPIYAFEPVKSTFDILSQNIELNELENVHALNIGFWSTPTTMKLGIPRDRDTCNTGLYSVYHSDEAETVEATFVNLDEWCESNNIFPDLIKMDIEGSELTVLSSSPKCVAHLRGIVVENNKKDTKLPSPSDVSSFLEKSGFSLVFKGKDNAWKRL